MKKILVLLVLSIVTLFASTSWSTGAYGNNENRSETLSISGASSLSVRVIGVTESSYDYITFFDAGGNQVAQYDGVINETFTVNGSSVRAVLTSDGSVTRSGVQITISDGGSSSSDSDDNDSSSSNISWSTGTYGNNENRSETLSISGASSLSVRVIGVTESSYDYITFFDAGGNQVAQYDGVINETFTVNGSSVRAVLTSDGSVTRSGVQITISDGGSSSSDSDDNSNYNSNENPDIVEFEFNGLYDSCNHNSLEALKCQTLNNSAMIKLKRDGSKSKIEFTFYGYGDAGLPSFYYTSLPIEVNVIRVSRINFESTGAYNQQTNNTNYQDHVLTTIGSKVLGKVFGSAKFAWDLMFGYIPTVGDPTLIEMFECASNNTPLCVNDDNIGSYFVDSGYGMIEGRGATSRFTYYLDVTLEELKIILRTKGLGFYEGTDKGSNEILIDNLKYLD